MRANHFLLMLVMALSINVRAQAPQATKSPEERTTGTISGKVVNESGQPMPGVAVFMRPLGGINAGRSTFSDGEGNFSVSGLDRALYSAFANAPAYITEPVPPGTFYRLGDSVRLTLVRGAVVTGTVTNASGEPMSGVYIRATRIRDANGQPTRTASFSQETSDDRGVYRIYGLQGGIYVISAGGWGWFFANFNPYDSDVPTFSPSATRDTATEFTLRPGEETTADIRYRGEQGYTLSGTVKTSGVNAPTITMRAAGSANLMLSVVQFGGNRGFMFEGIADGEYKLYAQESLTVPGAHELRLAVSEIKRVTVKGASVSGIELIPVPLGSIRGHVVIEPAKLPECEGKRPPLIAETLVQLKPHEKNFDDDEPAYQLSGVNSAVSEAREFTLLNLRAGRYWFEPRFYSRYWYLQSITIPGPGAKAPKFDAAANWTTLKSGEQMANVTITLASGAASVRGRVSASEGSPAPAAVYLIPAEPNKGDDVLRFFVTEISASDGSFTLTNVPPGKYFVLSQRVVDPQIGTLTKLRQPEAVAARTKLRHTAETQKTEIDLKPCQNLADYQLKP